MHPQGALFSPAKQVEAYALPVPPTRAPGTAGHRLHGGTCRLASASCSGVGWRCFSDVAISCRTCRTTGCHAAICIIAPLVCASAQTSPRPNGAWRAGAGGRRRQCWLAEYLGCKCAVCTVSDLDHQTAHKRMIASVAAEGAHACMHGLHVHVVACGNFHARHGRAARSMYSSETPDITPSLSSCTLAQHWLLCQLFCPQGRGGPGGHYTV